MELVKSDESDLDAPPASKKSKRTKGAEDADADARLAAELQAQENQLARGRKTRGGATTTSNATKKAKPAKKGTKRERSEDEGVSGAEEGKAEPKINGFQKPHTLSYALASLLGETQVRILRWRSDRSCLTSLPSACSCRGLRWSKSYGSTSRGTSFRTQMTGDRSCVTRKCRPSSKSPVLTCFR